MAINLNDKTSNGNTLTNSSATEVTASLPFAASTIAVGLAKATPAYLYAADSSSLSITGDMSLEGWFKFTSTTTTDGYMVLLDKFQDASNQRSYGLILLSGNTLSFRYSTDGTYQVANDLRVSWTPSTGTWYHVAVNFTASTSTAQFFINGSQQGTDQTGSGTLIYNSTSQFIIGCHNIDATPAGPFDGVIDEVRVWNTIRSGSQISANYQKELTGTESGLKAYYPFESTISTASGGTFLYNFI